MLRTLIALTLILTASGCQSIHYSRDTGTIYQEFGSRAHYYSNPKLDFGIELYHGSLFFDNTNKVKIKEFPKEVRKQFSRNAGEVIFVKADRLSPTITLLQKSQAPRSGLSESLLAGTTADSSDGLFKTTSKIFQDSSIYTITSFSYAHKWLKSPADHASAEEAAGEMENIRTGWKSTDLILEDGERTLPLGQNASLCFWQSKNNYLFPLSIVEGGRRPRDNDYYEASTTFNSFAGNYQKTLIQRDSSDYRPPTTKTVSHSELIIADVLRTIIDSAARHRVVMINEMHTQPLNRRFFTSLLSPLYNLGYRTIFYETLDAADSELNDRGYPIQESGYYTSEPNFGNNVRAALKLGYKVRPYDNDSSGQAREMLQAQKIARFLIEFPDEKVIVYCGYGHLYESAADSMMGYHLKMQAHIDPFTIDQTKLVERGSPGFELPLFRFLDSTYHFTKPVAVLGDDSASNPLRGKCDLLVALPRTQYLESGQAEWQFQLGDKVLQFQLNGKKYEGALLQIFDAKELKRYSYWDLIPIANLQLKDRNDLKYFLEPGKYQIYVTDERRKILFEKTVSL